MKLITLAALGMAAASLCMSVGTMAASKKGTTAAPPPPDTFAMVAPALEHYTQNVLWQDLWTRPDLTPRDRALITLSALIARNQTHDLSHYINLALDKGITPAELSEIITHLAFYSGWGNATDAARITKDIFAARGISSEQLPPAVGPRLPLDEAAEAKRAATVEQTVGSIAPGVVHYTGEVLFRDLWLRPGLAPRDRSLVTVSALIANGKVEQIPFHLNKAMDNGLTQAQAAEVLTHLAFYGGWPNVFSALPVAGQVFEKRPQ